MHVGGHARYFAILHIDQSFGDELGKHRHFCLVIIDNKHHGRFLGGTEVSILRRHHCITFSNQLSQFPHLVPPH